MAPYKSSMITNDTTNLILAFLFELNNAVRSDLLYIKATVKTLAFKAVNCMNYKWLYCYGQVQKVYVFTRILGGFVKYTLLSLL